MVSADVCKLPQAFYKLYSMLAVCSLVEVLPVKIADQYETILGTCVACAFLLQAALTSKSTCKAARVILRQTVEAASGTHPDAMIAEWEQGNIWRVGWPQY